MIKMKFLQLNIFTGNKRDFFKDLIQVFENKFPYTYEKSSFCGCIYTYYQ